MGVSKVRHGQGHGLSNGCEHLVQCTPSIIYTLSVGLNLLLFRGLQVRILEVEVEAASAER